MLTKSEAEELNARHLAAIYHAIMQGVVNTGSLPESLPGGSGWQLTALKNVKKLPVADSVPGGEFGPSDTGPIVSKGARVRAFLDQVYRLSRDKQIEDGIDLIIEQMDEWMLDGQFDMCDFVLAQADPELLQEDLIFSFVTSTLAAKTKLQKYRPRYLSAAKKQLTTLHSAVFAEQLLARYE